MGLIPGILTAFGLNKTVAYIIEFALAAAIVAGSALYVAHLYHKAEAYDVLNAEHHALEAKYGCDKRHVAERELAACLVARELDGAKAQRDELKHQAIAAAVAQAKYDSDVFAAAQQRSETDQFIDDATARGEDGPVPKVLLDTWARERKARGAQ